MQYALTTSSTSAGMFKGVAADLDIFVCKKLIRQIEELEDCSHFTFAVAVAVDGGEGFEPRTDGHGAVRAKDGLLISTEARDNGRGPIKSMQETERRLHDALEQHEDLGELALKHEAQTNEDQLGVAKNLATQNREISGKADATEAANGTTKDTKYPELSAPHLVLTSPAGLATTTQGSTHQHSAQHHALTTEGHTSISAGKSLLASAKETIRLFAYKAGARIVSAQDRIEMQALQKSVNMLAKLDITHTAQTIHINATKSVTINGGGSYTTWDASGIRSHTTGGHIAHAGNHGLPGARNEGVVMPKLAFVPDNLPKQFSTRFNVAQLLGKQVQSEKVLASLPFKAFNSKGELIATGTTDKAGSTGPIYTEYPEKIRITLGDGDWQSSDDTSHI